MKESNCEEQRVEQLLSFALDGWDEFFEKQTFDVIFLSNHCRILGNKGIIEHSDKINAVVIGDDTHVILEDENHE